MGAGEKVRAWLESLDQSAVAGDTFPLSRAFDPGIREASTASVGLTLRDASFTIDAGDDAGVGVDKNFHAFVIEVVGF